MAAAIGEVLPGVDPKILDELRDTGAVPLLWAEWGDPAQRVWFEQRRIPFGEMWYQAKGRAFCHDGLGPGVITCYDTDEELAAATGIDLPGVDQAAVQHLRSTGAVPQVPGNYYSVVYAAINYAGDRRSFDSSASDLRDYNFNDVISSARKDW